MCFDKIPTKRVICLQILGSLRHYWGLWNFALLHEIPLPIFPSISIPEPPEIYFTLIFLLCHFNPLKNRRLAFFFHMNYRSFPVPEMRYEVMHSVNASIVSDLFLLTPSYLSRLSCIYFGLFCLLQK